MVNQILSVSDNKKTKKNFSSNIEIKKNNKIFYNNINNIFNIMYRSYWIFICKK